LLRLGKASPSGTKTVNHNGGRSCAEPGAGASRRVTVFNIQYPSDDFLFAAVFCSFYICSLGICCLRLSPRRSGCWISDIQFFICFHEI
jgi:hypothetical protein